MAGRLPMLEVLGIRSFLAHGHEYHLYAFEPIENAPAGVTLMDASELLPRDAVFTYQRGFGKGSVSAFSNLFRYKLLFERGGWWVDTDVVCLRPFDFSEEYVFATERHPDGRTTAASCVFRAPAGAAVLRYCLDVCEAVDKATLMWAEIGPRLLHAAAERFNLCHHFAPPHVFNPVDYGDFRDIIAPNFDMSRLEGAHAVHLWNQMWASHYLDRDYAGLPDSLYGHLIRRYLDASPAADVDESLRRHIDFQSRAIATLLTERDEAQFALERERSELAATRPALEATTRALDEARHALAESGRDLASTRQRLNDAQRSLADSRDALNRTREALEESEERSRDLAEMGNTLATVRGELAALRQSLSWRMTSPLRRGFDALATLGRLLRRQR